MYTIDQLKSLRESEDKVEFKRGEGGNVAYDGGNRVKPAERRRCILGYVTALCNENGGALVIGMEDLPPHRVCGTKQCENALGQLESDVYRDTGIRPKVYELYEDAEKQVGRVLVIEVPARPIGKVYKFEDVPLMRVGEELKPMSDAKLLSIIQEQEPDYSEQICKGASIADLDGNAVAVMREKYARKQNNSLFLTLPEEQVLSDLHLVVDGGVTNAAVILLGKEEFLRKHIPQAAVMLEYRNTEPQIHFDNRIEYHEPFFCMIERLWRDINMRNGNIPVKEGPYIFDVPYFNEDVIRESINNAIVHRDYRRSSETVIKQYPQKLVVINAGGFPLGVTKENLLTVASTPRNRLLADVLSKTGIVERSGQGVDKIVTTTLSEGKPEPDYSKSDDFNVELHISGAMEDRGFALFIESVQQELTPESKLSVLEIVTLSKLRAAKRIGGLDKAVIAKLLERGLIEKRGNTNGSYYLLCRSYYDFAGDLAEYARKSDWDDNQMLKVVVPYLAKYASAKMSDFVKLLESHMTRRQIKVSVQRLASQHILISAGKGSGTRYSLNPRYKVATEVTDYVLEKIVEEIRSEVNVQKMSKDMSKTDISSGV